MCCNKHVVQFLFPIFYVQPYCYIDMTYHICYHFESIGVVSNKLTNCSFFWFGCMPTCDNNVAMTFFYEYDLCCNKYDEKILFAMVYFAHILMMIHFTLTLHMHPI
jgi:hypothetical protein